MRDTLSSGSDASYSFTQRILLARTASRTTRRLPCASGTPPGVRLTPPRPSSSSQNHAVSPGVSSGAHGAAVLVPYPRSGAIPRVCPAERAPASSARPGEVVAPFRDTSGASRETVCPVSTISSSPRCGEGSFPRRGLCAPRRSGARASPRQDVSRRPQPFCSSFPFGMSSSFAPADQPRDSGRFAPGN